MQPGVAVPQAKFDSSLIAVVAANVLVLGIAYASNMELRDVMIVYWIQNIIIGVTSVVRLGVVGWMEPRKGSFMTDRGDRMFYAFFFFIHYGFFHVIYLVFLSNNGLPPELTQNRVLCGLAFAMGHGYSFLRNFRRDLASRPDVALLMWLPYLRILPMHLVLIAARFAPPGTATLLLFGTLKTLADAAMHMTEHRVLARGR
jgi:hypothetical protein